MINRGKVKKVKRIGWKKHMLRKETRWKRNDLEMKECLGIKDLECKDEAKKGCEREWPGKELNMWKEKIKKEREWYGKKKNKLERRKEKNVDRWGAGRKGRNG
jgi:hypothetical protein